MNNKVYLSWHDVEELISKLVGKLNGPYDAIMVTAAGPKVPEPLLDQLADPGVMAMPIGMERWSQELVVITKEKGQISERVIEQVRFVSLIGNHGWQP